VLEAADVRCIAAEVDLPRDVDLIRDDEMAAEDNETATEG
jgi:hypothetical protein